jgi:hypothetical protein
MILYVNGDSHSAGAEAVNPHAFAEDDPLYWALGRRPHPDNERVSYGCEIANHMGAILHCDAESASSNARIIRTACDYLKENTPDFVIIGWSTWEREEWWDEETQRYWQVNAGGIGHDWPNSIKEKYREWIIDLDYNKKLEDAKWDIWAFHLHLRDMNVKHFFFNTFEPLDAESHHFDFEKNYLDPYNRDFTYYNWLKANGFDTVHPDSYHFGPDAHRAWGEFLYQNIVQNYLTH